MTGHGPTSDVPLDPDVDRAVRQMTAAPPRDDLTRRVLDQLRAGRPPHPWPSWTLAAGVAAGLVAATWLAFQVVVPRRDAPADATPVATNAPPTTAASADTPDDARLEAPETDLVGARRGRVRSHPPGPRAWPVDLTSIDFRVEVTPPLDVGHIPVADVPLPEIDVDRVAVEEVIRVDEAQGVHRLAIDLQGRLPIPVRPHHQVLQIVIAGEGREQSRSRDEQPREHRRAHRVRSQARDDQCT